jgi:uncharacterized repeat protein (TIGR03803 family)
LNPKLVLYILSARSQDARAMRKQSVGQPFYGPSGRAIHKAKALGVIIAIAAACYQAALCSPAYRLEEIAAFPPGSTSESGPWAALTAGPDGAFYGTTYGGGSNGYGSVFRVTTNGNLTTLVSFANTNGANPRSSLLLGSDGMFYGATGFGGAGGYGTVFRVTTNGLLTTLVHFAYTNGYGPVTELVQTSDGVLYGSTAAGGIGPIVGYGTIFRLATNGLLTTLARFDGTNGYYPYSNLVPADDGSFYGTTYRGDLSVDYPYGPGNVYRVSPEGNLTSLVTFGNTNGSQPTGKLVRGLDGALYGTTQGGFSSAVFRVTTNGALTVLASLNPLANPSHGDQPRGGLVIGSDGAFYGTASSSGQFNEGTIFRVTTNGLLTTLVPFAGTNGANPFGTLVQGSDGAFYGTAQKGGSLGGGNVYRLAVFSRILSVERVGDAWNVSFSGVEGETYRLLRSTNLSGPWNTLTNITLGPDGSGQYLDTDPPDTGALYRTVTP